MKLAIFGLSISSSWGNGHATLWRGLCRTLASRGYSITFFERDVPYYAGHRDLNHIPGGRLRLYSDWRQVWREADRETAEADAAIVTSYCPDAHAASQVVLSSCSGLRVFYDLDTPITLSNLSGGRDVPYIGPRGLRDFDLVLSYTGGRALTELRTQLGAKRVAPLYGHVDPAVHYPVPARELFRGDFSYLGTYAVDRQAALERLFIEPARRLPQRRFIIGGSQYPRDFPWTENIYFMPHVAPGDHPAFYSSSPLTLNITRSAMAAMGYCPSGRLFEAAACGVPILSDAWEGLEQFFEPGREILIARETSEAMDALGLPQERLRSIAKAARERTLESHTSAHRADDLERIFNAAHAPEASISLAAPREV